MSSFCRVLVALGTLLSLNEDNIRLARDVQSKERVQTWVQLAQQGNSVPRKLEEVARAVLRKLTEFSSLEVHYEILNQRTFFDRDRSEKVADDARRSIRKARKRTRYQAFRKWCTGEGGHMRFRDDPPHSVFASMAQARACATLR